MKTNIRNRQVPGLMQTHEGAPAEQITHLQRLRRLVLSCLLWEDQFYVDGKTIADAIVEEVIALKDKPSIVAHLAIEAREEMNLRHVPLLLCAMLARTAPGTSLVGETIARVIQRVDEMPELLAIHAKLQGKPTNELKKILSAQMKKGLARAFTQFDAYQLAKYDRPGIKLRDVLFLSHAKPKDDEQAALWKRLIDGTLAAPDTWEVELSAGKDKKATFERLIGEKKLGYMALLRNLRNMQQAGVDPELVNAAIVLRRGAHRVLPFRYWTAAKAAPMFEPALDRALQGALEAMPPLPGTTFMLVDVSGSMDAKLSAKSELTRAHAAAILAAMVPGRKRVFTFSQYLQEVPARKGMAGVDAILHSQPHSSTLLGQAIFQLNAQPHDRLIVVTDEQSHDRVPQPVAKQAYMINIASYQNGVGYHGSWVHLDGWSENVLRWLQEYESQDLGD